MKENSATIIYSSEKGRTHTAFSEYIFHISATDANGKTGCFEGLYKRAGQAKNLHYHKCMTEVFTVLEGEFYFDTADGEHLLGVNDSIIIPPYAVHGFRARIPGGRLQIMFSGITAREEFFTGLAKIVNGETVYGPEELEAFYNRHDQYTVK